MIETHAGRGVEAGHYRVVVFDASEAGLETAYEADSQEDALLWAKSFMCEPVGLAVAILPPAEAT